MTDAFICDALRMNRVDVVELSKAAAKGLPGDTRQVKAEGGAITAIPERV